MSALRSLMAAIRQLESGGNYDATGPTVQSGQYAGEQAQGAYQIMPGNWPSWAREAGLSSNAPMTRENQDRVASHKLGQYLESYGPEGAAVAWFAGPGRARRWLAGDDLSSISDDLGTNIPKYVSVVRQHMSDGVSGGDIGSLPSGGRTGGAPEAQFVGMPDVPDYPTDPVPLDARMIQQISETQRQATRNLQEAMAQRELGRGRANTDFQQLLRELEQRRRRGARDLGSEVASRNMAFQPIAQGRGMDEMRRSHDRALAQGTQQRTQQMAALEEAVNRAERQRGEAMGQISRERGRAGADINRLLGA